MLDYFEGKNEHEVRGASILIIVCQKTKVYQAKIVGLKSVVPLRETVEGFDAANRDAGFTTGLTNLIDHMT